jgi:hypothetical protein
MVLERTRVGCLRETYSSVPCTHFAIRSSVLIDTFVTRLPLLPNTSAEQFHTQKLAAFDRVREARSYDELGDRDTRRTEDMRDVEMNSG